MNHLRPRQQSLLDFIQTFIGEHEYPPTYEEIRVGLQWSTKSLVDYHLSLLEGAGRIERDAKTPRGIRILTGEQA